jgi:hypothetical protein
VKILFSFKSQGFYFRLVEERDPICGSEDVLPWQLPDKPNIKDWPLQPDCSSIQAVQLLFGPIVTRRARYLVLLDTHILLFCLNFKELYRYPIVLISVSFAAEDPFRSCQL